MEKLLRWIFVPALSVKTLAKAMVADALRRREDSSHAAAAAAAAPSGGAAEFSTRDIYRLAAEFDNTPGS